MAFNYVRHWLWSEDTQIDKFGTRERFHMVGKDISFHQFMAIMS